jgi:hypothetical protein
LNDFWRDFLTVGKLDFATFLEITNEQDIDMYFLRLIELRKTFLNKIFNFYVSSNPILTTAMAWKIRGPKSLTRFTAESVGFFRYELDQDELYSSKEISKEQLEYLRNCLLRWFSQFANNCPANHVEPQPNQQAFARHLVER